MNSRINRCTQCILSEKFPNIRFDDEGVCNFCRDRIYFSTETKVIEKAKTQVKHLIESKKNTAAYDAVMCYSGGKDSTYTLLTGIKKYGMKILSFTLDNGYLSPIAVHNIHKTVDYLGVDHITLRPSQNFFTALIKASALHRVYSPKTLTRISAICFSCISLVNISALKLALEKQIPFILAGFTLGQIPANSVVYKNNYSFLMDSREPYLKKLRELIGPSVNDYFYLNDNLIHQARTYPYNINLLCLEDPNEDEIYAEIKKIGWISPEDVDGCSSNCRLNAFNNYVHTNTFGYNPYELELSHLIRKGKLSRNQAIEKISDQPDKKFLQEIMEQLGIEEQVFHSVFETA